MRSDAQAAAAADIKVAVSIRGTDRQGRQEIAPMISLKSGNGLLPHHLVGSASGR